MNECMQHYLWKLIFLFLCIAEVKGTVWKKLGKILFLHLIWRPLMLAHNFDTICGFVVHIKYDVKNNNFKKEKNK